MKRKIEITAKTVNSRVTLVADLNTSDLMQNEVANEKRNLTTAIFNALQNYGASPQDIKIK